MSKPKKDIHEGSWFSSLITKGKWYLIASFATKGIGFFLLPVYTTYLTPAEYGILESLNSIALLLPLFVSLALDSAFARFFHEDKKDHEALKKLFSSVYWFVLGFGAIFVSSFIFSAHFWMEDLIEVPVFPYAYLSFVAPLFLQLGMLGIIFLKQSLKTRETSLVTFAGYLFNIFIVLILLLYFNFGILAMLIGKLAMAIFYFLFTTFLFIKKNLLTLSIDKKVLKKCLYYSVPLLPSAGGNWIAGLSDRLVIANYVDMDAVGIYSLAFQIAMVLYVFGDSLTQVLTPISMSGFIHDKKRTKKKLAEFSLFLWVVMLLANLGLFLFSKEVITLFTTESYEDAYKIIPIVAFPYVAGMQYRLFLTIINYHKKTWFISFTSILVAVVNLGMNFWLVPIYGYFGAVWATLITRITYTIAIVAYGQKLDYVKLFWKEMLILFLIFLLAILYIQYQLIDQPVSWQIIPHKILVFIIPTVSFIFIGNYQEQIQAFVISNLAKLNQTNKK